MTAEIVNLRQIRKQKARDEKERTAAANREKFGQTKAQRRHDEANKQREKLRLDGMVRVQPSSTDDL